MKVLDLQLPRKRKKMSDAMQEVVADKEPMTLSELLVEAEEAIVFLEDDMDSLVAKAEEIKSSLESIDEAGLDRAGSSALTAQLNLLTEIFGDDL